MRVLISDAEQTSNNSKYPQPQCGVQFFPKFNIYGRETSGLGIGVANSQVGDRRQFIKRRSWLSSHPPRDFPSLHNFSQFHHKL